MMIFKGKEFAAEKEKKLRVKVSQLRRRGIIPKMAVILVGNNPESELYVSLKEKFARRIGVDFELRKFEESVSAERVIEEICNLNNDAGVHGIMIQLPLPGKFATREMGILAAIVPTKDVDCLTPENLGLLMMGKPRFLPATVRAVADQIADLKGTNICVVGASNIVGKPLAMHLKNLGATVTICDEYTKNLAEFTRRAEILVSATGAPGLIKKEMVKKGAMVIDVGIKKYKMHPAVGGTKFKIMGDVDLKVTEVAGFVTPVPGGVGPVTVACLFENLLEAIER